MRIEAPSFFLYGEAPRAAAVGFLHLEPLSVRSRPSGWSIRLHRHADLNHLFLLTSGGGRIGTETGEISFVAPCLLLIPAGATHGFAFRQESTGQVLTIATSFLEARPACAEVRSALFERICTLACDGMASPLQQALAELARELAWTAPGHDAAVEACVLQTLVLALRARAAEQGGSGREAALLARFREQVELRFRDHRPLGIYARELGVSVSRLYQACRSEAGLTPLGLVQARLLLEAKRALLYSDMAIAEVAMSLGYSDPAYFSRFFTKHIGVSARTFREATRPTLGVKKISSTS